MGTSEPSRIDRVLRERSWALLRLPLTRLIAWSLGTPARRRRVYELMPGSFLFAGHAAESYLIRTGDDYIGCDLFAEGAFDLQKFERALTILEETGAVRGPHDRRTLIDVGANIGSICIPALRRGHVGRCIAFEPDPINFRLLRVNAILNEVDDRMTCHRLAVGDREGAASLTLSETNFGDHRIASSGADDTVAVDMVRLDDFAAGLDLSGVLLWMDIQGFEGHALAGAQRFLTAGVPIVLEFAVQDLRSADGFELLLSQLEASPLTHFHDLAHERPQAVTLSRATLLDLAEDLLARGEFTDLLLVRDAQHVDGRA